MAIGDLVALRNIPINYKTRNNPNRAYYDREFFGF